MNAQKEYVNKLIFTDRDKYLDSKKYYEKTIKKNFYKIYDDLNILHYSPKDMLDVFILPKNIYLYRCNPENISSDVENKITISFVYFLFTLKVNLLKRYYFFFFTSFFSLYI